MQDLIQMMNRMYDNNEPFCMGTGVIYAGFRKSITMKYVIIECKNEIDYHIRAEIENVTSDDPSFNLQSIFQSGNKEDLNNELKNRLSELGKVVNVQITFII